MAMPHAFTDYGILVNSGDWSGKLSARCDEGNGARTPKHRDLARRRLLIAFATGACRVSASGARPCRLSIANSVAWCRCAYDQLPVVLPESAEFTGTGAPLAGVAEFVNTTCPEMWRRRQNAKLTRWTRLSIRPGISSATAIRAMSRDAIRSGDSPDSGRRSINTSAAIPTP